MKIVSQSSSSIYLKRQNGKTFLRIHFFVPSTAMYGIIVVT
jgi:hypothetical protein